MRKLYRELPRILPAVVIGAVLILLVALLLFASRDDNHSPHAEGSVCPGDAVVGEAVIFDARNSTDPDGDVLEYRWTIQGCISSSSLRFEYIFPQPGNYTVTLRVADPGGLTDQATFLVDVGP